MQNIVDINFAFQRNGIPETNVGRLCYECSQGFESKNASGEVGIEHGIGQRKTKLHGCRWQAKSGFQD